MKGVLRVIDFIDNAIKAVGIALAAVLAGVMVVQVFFRYVLNDSLPWSEELSVYLMVWIIFLGAAIVARKWQHTSITIVRKLVPAPISIALVFFGKIVTLVFLVVLAKIGFDVFGASFHGKSISMGFSTRWVKLAIPVGAVFMAIFVLNAVALDLVHLIRKDYGHFQTQDEALGD